MHQQESNPIKLAVSIGFLNNAEKAPFSLSTNSLRMANVAANEACMFEVPDQSMQPLLSKGAIVAIRLTDTVVSGEMYVVKVNGETMLRKISKAESGYKLVALASPADSPIVPIDDVTIIGQMFWFTQAA